MSERDSVVFVVDDDDSLRRSLERLLRVTGHNVESFSSAAAFLERDDPNVPCCLLLDIRMPQMNGLDVQRAVSGAGRAMPIVFMTGFADIETCVVGMKSGAADFLLKPFDEDELLRSVTAALIQSTELRQARRVRGELEQRLSALTPRERQVFWLVVKGSKSPASSAPRKEPSSCIARM